jgi:hypothetical protein
LPVAFKLNFIGPDGLYVANETFEYTYQNPVPGGGQFNAPAQLATVVTLRTAVDRGRASKGRMFLPVCGGFQAVGDDGRASATDAENVADRMAALFTVINGVYAAAESGDEARGVVGVASNIGSGTFRRVTHVTVGRVTDTVRSRRNKQLEAPIESEPVTTP